MRSRELVARFERVGFRRSSPVGVASMTHGFRVSQVYKTERVRVQMFDDPDGTLGATLARLCDLWELEVTPLSADTFEVREWPTSP